jgi:predicted PurR-regulated permease PerM
LFKKIIKIKGKIMDNSEEYYTRAIYTALRISFIALLLYWSFVIIRPFVLVVIWGIIIAVAIYPLHAKFTKILGNKEKLSATIITLTFLILLLIPSIIFMESAVDGIQEFSANMKAGTVEIPPPGDDVAQWPVVGKPLYETWALFSTNFEVAVKQFQPQIKELAPKVFSTAGDLTTALLLFMVSISIAGVFITQAEASEKAAKSIFATLVGRQGENFVALSVSTIRSVVQGVLMIALIQSLAGGIGMKLIGIPAAGLWALIILMLATVQLPPLLILGPMAVYAFTIADTGPAIIFAIYSIIVSMSDTFLKPLFLGRGVDVPMLVILLGAIGGVIYAGIIGLFVGAIVLAISYKLFEALLVRDILEQPLDNTVKTE